MYNLENDSVWDLEEEIRKDLEATGVKALPPRLISERIVTKTLSPEAIAAQKAIIPIAEKGLEALDSEKKQMLSHLIELNKWGEFNVTPDNFSIESMDKDRISGSITMGPTTKPFFVNLHNCVLIVRRRKTEATSDRMSSRSVLKDMKRAYDHQMKVEASKGSGVVHGHFGFNLDE